MLTCFIFFFCCCFCFIVSGVVANVVLMGNNLTLSFDDIQATFAPSVKGSGERGTLFEAEPLDACAPLANKSIEESVYAPFVLIVRGGCSFDDKVRRAQSAGFKAAIVYDNEDSELVAMAGTPTGIVIHAVFVSKSSGLKLRKYAGIPEIEVWILPSFENSAWSIMAISFISLLAMSAFLATCFFVRRHRIRRDRPQSSRVREFHGMSSRLVKAMPSLVFTAVLEDNSTSATCAICLEDYNVGDKIRILPCRHKFHAICVDAWLTAWRTFCPVCKRDARTTNGEPPASERTPLLSSNPASMASSTILSSTYSSSYAASSHSHAIQIGQTSRTPSNIHSVSSTSYTLHSHHQSPYITPSRSSLDIRNIASSSHRSRASHLIPSNSLGHPSFSPLNSRHLSSYYPSPGNASSSYIRSSSQQQAHPLRYNDSAASFSPYASSSYIRSSSQQQAHPLRYNDSAASFSPYASAHSLPEC